MISLKNICDYILLNYFRNKIVSGCSCSSVGHFLISSKVKWFPFFKWPDKIWISFILSLSESIKKFSEARDYLSHEISGKKFKQIKTSPCKYPGQKSQLHRFFFKF